jgi:hypothetical protein
MAGRFDTIIEYELRFCLQERSRGVETPPDMPESATHALNFQPLFLLGILAAPASA